MTLNSLAVSEEALALQGLFSLLTLLPGVFWCKATINVEFLFVFCLTSLKKNTIDTVTKVTKYYILKSL